jgi:crotonobetainyl-CoA:carnitine CoA-transferase CaiB-like acyl-CoA transferase
LTDRVLELGNFAAGFCGRLFVQAGYEVVRIEPSAPCPGWVSSAANDLYLHAGKRRLQTSSRDLITELAGKADVVVVEANTSDALVDLGFDDWQSKVKVAITPFGRTGPKRNWRATPHVLLAMGGYTQIMGDPDRAPLSLPGHYVEFQSGQYAYTAANACRFAGVANTIDISMLETVMSLSQFTTMQWHCMRQIRSRHGSDLWSVCPTNMYRLQDGWAYVTIVPIFWDLFTLFLDMPELAADERFTGNDRRMANRAALNQIIAGVMAGMTRVEAERRAEEIRIPLGVVKTFDEVQHDPHLAERDFWQHVRAPDGTTVRSPGVPYRFDRTARTPLDLSGPEVCDG